MFTAGVAAGVDSAWEYKSLEARKRLENEALEASSLSPSCCILCRQAYT